MIVMDLSQVCIATLMVQLGGHTNIDVDENLLRHMVLNSIRANKKKFANEFGELVIAADSKNSWRKEVFPYYKAARRKAREESELNWNLIFESLHKIRDELRDYFPYRLIRVDGAEADDVIAMMVKHFKDEPLLILSGDKDFNQLHVNSNIKQYSPPMKKWITCRDPELYLREHIIRGDKGDGVPNFLSAGDSLINGVRQKSISEAKLAKWLKMTPEEICAGDENLLSNYYRNKEMVDLNQIPVHIQEQIMVEYNAQAGKNRGKLFEYFQRNKLKNLMEAIGDF